MKKNKLEPEIDFLELIKNPIRLFGWIYPIAIVVAIIAGIFYVKNINNISFNTMSEINYDSLRVVHDVEMKKGGIKPAVELDKISEPSEDLIALGKEKFTTICASCHGENGEGNGPAGLALNPKPRNFHQLDGWTNGREFPEMYKTLQEGIIKNGMAAYEYLTPEERFGLIHYIRTFSDFPEIKKEDIAYLDNTYQLSKGIMIPNRIPISKAIALLSDEANSVSLKNVCANIKSNSKSDGARLFFENSYDKHKVLSIMLNGDLGKSMESFKEAVLSDPYIIGFSPSVERLSESELGLLYKFLSESVKNINS